MTIKHSTLASAAIGASAAAAFASFGRFGARITFDAPNDGGTPEPKLEPKPEPKPEPTPEPKPSDAEANLLKEVMKLKTKLDAFKDVDAEEFKTLKAAKVAAEAARVEQERVDAEKRGEFDRVKASMVEQHTLALKGLQDQIDALTGEKGGLAKQIDELTIGSSFLNSKFVADDLVLTPGKARTVYGAHFVQENGKTVAYDKPAGAAERTKLVDGKGEPLGFEDALKKIVEADADKDRMLRSKMKDGAGSSTTTSRTTTTPATGLKGTSLIAAALAARAKKAA